MNLNFVRSWCEFYESNNDTIYKGNLSDPHKYYISEIIYTENSRFIDFYQNYSTSIKILVESSLFHSNHIGNTKNLYGNYNGGNFYINAFLDIVQNKICSYNCSSNGYGQHCHIRTQSDTIQYKNYNYLSSYSDLGQTDIGSATVHYGDGEVLIHNTNISNCRVKQQCGIYIETTFYKGNITQTSILNNSANSQYCIYFSGFKDFSCIKSNILNNSVSDRLIYTKNYDLTIISSIIKNNIANNTFYPSSNMINIIHSMIDISGSTNKLNTELIKTQEFEHVYSFSISDKCCFSVIISQHAKIKCTKFLLSLSLLISYLDFKQRTSEYII